MTTPTDSAPKSKRYVVPFIVCLIVIGVGGYFGWRWWSKKPPAASDMTAAMHANLRGVGFMEQFTYDKAAEAFEESLRHAPDWTPAKINLGIALLNMNRPETLDKARSILDEVLKKEPENLHAHYTLGIIALHQNHIADAYTHFEVVNRLDPKDAHTWYRKAETHPEGRESAAAKECFAQCLKLNPYINAAHYNLALHPIDRNEQRTKQLLAEKTALEEAHWDSKCAIAYSEMGLYADVIGRVPATKAPEIGPLPMFESWDRLKVRLAAGTTWAKSTDFGDSTVGKLQRAIRERFGATVMLFDFNRDGKPDIFVASAVVRQGAVTDLLLRNDGDGVFTDVTVEAGLKGASLGGAAGDYDNDGQTDLVLTGIGAPQLYRNLGNGRFENVTKATGWKDASGVYLGASWVDLDQDGDLDLILAQYANAPETALENLRGMKNSSGGFVVFLNAGEAPAVQPGEPGGLSTKFQVWKPLDGLKLGGTAVSVTASDLDGDGDLDWLLLADGKPATGIWNDRLLRFRSAGALDEAADWNGALVLDVNHDQRSDILLLPAKKPPQLWLSQALENNDKLTDGFAPGAVNGPAMMQAQAVDLDRDSWTDVVGLSSARRPVLLHNTGDGKLVQRPDAFGPVDGFPKDAIAALTADLDGDGAPDLLLLSESRGLEAHRNLGNGNRSLRLDISGKRYKAKSLRTSADGIGAWVVAQAGPLWTGLERTAVQAGLGQSMLPLELGIGKHVQADVVRIRWPDGIPQAELNVVSGETVRITEISRKFNSCPTLFAWDGQRFRFVTDILGPGAIGEAGTDGKGNTPRPEESLRLEAGTLAPRDGWFRIKIAEPMDELLYLDWLELVVVDHPAEWHVYPDERFVLAGPAPTQELLFLKDARPLSKARDHRGADVTSLLRDRDRRMVDDFRKRSWAGYAEEHTLELDFGDIQPRPNDAGRWLLCLHGWTDYVYPESMWAAEQAGVALLPPQLEVPAGGKWRGWGELGFPAGLLRTMTRDVTGLIEEGAGRFRIRSNMQVYWDQIALARRVAEQEATERARIVTLPVGSAVLRQRGFAQEVSPDGRLPISYDDERSEAVAITKWKGRLTRLGDVTELLHRKDDCFVLCGPGDEVEIAFDARRLPAVRQGQVRSFVLRSAGYCKGASLFTLTGGLVGPLPYRSMKNYPPKEPSAAQEEYDRKWNTRNLGR